MKRRALIGTWGTVLGFVVLAIGMYVSLQPLQARQPATVLVLPWITLGIGIVALNVGKYYSMRYGGSPRVDQALAQALKNSDHRYYLFNFGSNLPVEHVLVTPNAVIILETRAFYGEVIHRERQWTRPYSFFGMLQRITDGGLGNPTKEAENDVRAVQNLLREHLGEAVADAIIVLPIIVFTNSRVKLQVSDPEVPVVLLADLRGALRRLREGARMTPEVQRRVVRVFQGDGEPAGDVVSSTRSSTWQRTQKSTQK